jgi:hypothetical protein
MAPNEKAYNKFQSLQESKPIRIKSIKSNTDIFKNTFQKFKTKSFVENNEKKSY